MREICGLALFESYLQWPEVGTILLRLSEAKTAVDVVKIVYEDFV
jgi:hypothetical protein